MEFCFEKFVLLFTLIVRITMTMNPCEEDIPTIPQIPPPRTPVKFYTKFEYITPESMKSGMVGAIGTMVEVSYDLLANRMASISTTGKESLCHVYDFNAGRKIIIDTTMPNPCSETVLDKADLNWLPTIDEIGVNFNSTHIFYPDLVLGMIDQELAGYMGKTEIRGIPAHQWDYCYKSSADSTIKSNISVSVYWSENNWNWPFKTPDCESMPLGYEMRISPIINDGTHTEMITSDFMYNILFFRPDYVNEEMFKIPVNVPCKGLQQTKPFPKLGQDTRVSMKIEMTTSEFPSVKWVDAWYDFPHNLIRLDYDPTLRPGFPQVLTTVLDLGEGAVFIINSDTGQCAVTTVEQYEEDWASIAAVRDLNDSNAEELFGVQKADYVYVGTREIRNIQNDVFQGIRRDWPTMAEEEYQTLWEWYFTVGNYTYEVSSGEMTVKERFIPTLLQVTMLEDIQTPAGKWSKGITLSYQIYMFQGTPGGRSLTEDVAAFDTTMCFAETYRKHLQFQLDVSVAPGFLQSLTPSTPLFLEFWWKATVEKTGVSPLRVTQMQIINTGNELYVEFKLLGRHPHLPPEMTVAMVTLTDARKNLKTAIDKGDILFPWETPDGMETTVKAMKGSLREVIQEQCPSSKPGIGSSTSSSTSTNPSKSTSSPKTSKSTASSEHVPSSKTPKSTTPARHTTPSKLPSSTRTTTAQTTRGYPWHLPTSSPKSVRYSQGSMAGIAVGMLAAGFVIGLSSTFVVKQYVLSRK